MRPVKRQAWMAPVQLTDLASDRVRSDSDEAVELSALGAPAESGVHCCLADTREPRGLRGASDAGHAAPESWTVKRHGPRRAAFNAWLRHCQERTGSRPVGRTAWRYIPECSCWARTSVPNQSAQRRQTFVRRQYGMRPWRLKWQPARRRRSPALAFATRA